MQAHATIEAHPSSPITALTFSYSSTHLMSAAGDKQIRLFNATTGLAIKTYSGHGHGVLDMFLMKGDERFVSGGADKSVFMWDISTGKTIRRWTGGHWQRVNCVTASDDGAIVLSGSYDATVKIWDARSQNRLPIQTLNEFKDSVSSICIHNGHLITATSIDGSIRTFDARQGTMITDTLEAPATHLSLSNDGNCYLVSKLNDTISLLDKDSGDTLASYTGHRNREYRLTATLSYDDAYVISGSEDGRILIWDLVDGNVKREWIAHTRSVMCVAASRDKQSVASGSGDGMIKVWSYDLL